MEYIVSLDVIKQMEKVDLISDSSTEHVLKIFFFNSATMLHYLEVL